MAGEVGDTGAGRGGSPGAGSRGKRRGGVSSRDKSRKKTAKTVLWKHKSDQTHFVEGQTKLTFKEPAEFPTFPGPNLLQNVNSGAGNGRITKIEAASRNKALDAQQKDWDKNFEMRKKIKPITDPDANKSENRKRAVLRKGQGRKGTLLSQSDTLG